MKIERITVQNFRQYFGRQRLTFATHDQRHVTVIHGVNGAGKTSLFLAINWCLYGEGVNNVGELISKEAVSHANPGETVEASVELSFLHDGERYGVTRTLKGVKQVDGRIEVQLPEQFTVMRTRHSGQADRVPNPIGLINSVLPSNVRTYFLFDGEKIDNFAKPESAKEVKSAIYLVLKLELLDRARKHLEGAAIEYRKELRTQSGGELRKLIERDERARADRKRAEEGLIDLQGQVESARGKITDIEQVLRESQNARSLQEQRDRLDRDLKLRETELEEVIGQIRTIATESYFIVAQPAIASALEILDEKRERGEIPSNIRQQFVQDLIDRMLCICGRPFTDGGPEHQHLLSIMQNTLPGSLEDDVLDVSATLHGFAERSERQRNNLDAAAKRRIQVVAVIKDLEAELDDVGRQLKGSPLEEISRLAKQLDEFNADVSSYLLQIGAQTERIDKLSKDIADLEKQISNARKSEKREKILSIKVSLAQRAADAIGDIYQTFADEMRVRIEAKTKEIFQQLVWKGDHFHDVQLGPDYNLEVIDRYGRPARPELSAGERQVLSLSFITAMSRISEEEAPLVMDTPFGRLSSQHRNSITEHLPELANQLVLFVTDEELRDQARLNLEPWIGAEYRLEFSPRTSCTEIVEVTG